MAGVARPVLASESVGCGLTPDQALELLREGNRTFVAGEHTSVLTGAARRHALAGGQSPFAAFVSCADSRVAPDLLFNRGLGEIFVVRNAGNTVDTAALGSLEYAVAMLKVPLVVVLGHESCGAVSAAASVVNDNATFPDAIGPMVEPIIPAVLAARQDAGNLVDNAIRANVGRQVRQLRTLPADTLRTPMAAGSLRIVGATYDLDEGMVDFFDLA